jgi:hypothetical protein
MFGKMVNSFFEVLFLFGNKGKTITNTFTSENGEARTVIARNEAIPAYIGDCFVPRNDGID